MAWRIVKQPNGMLARWSDVVDDFTAMNLSFGDAYELCRDAYGMPPVDALGKVTRAILEVEDRWAECLSELKALGKTASLERALHKGGMDLYERVTSGRRGRGSRPR